MMTPLTELDVARLLGSIDSRLTNIEHELYNRPCLKHAEDIAALKVKASIFGALGGFIAAMATILFRKL